MRIAAPALVLLASSAGAQTLDTTPRLAVISAYEPEWIAFQGMMEGAGEHVENGVRFLTGEIAGKPVVLFLSGVSMVNAAMTTQLALDRFEVTGIVFSGIAGGVDPALSVGDVVVAERWSQYLESAFAREAADGSFSLPSWMEPSEMGNYGMIHPQPVEVVRDGAVEAERVIWFPVDPGYLAVAAAVAEGVSLEECNTENVCLSDPPQVVVGGQGVSGQAFVDNAAFREWTFDREWTFETFDAQVLDMESAAVAHVAYANQVPFIAFRSLSDLAGGGEGENEIATFFSVASRNSATVVEAFLAALP